MTESITESIDDIGRRHGFGSAATQEVAAALRRGGTNMAQFSHPELGGTGQWVAGGMLMIGDMFNNSLKGRVAALCEDLARVIAAEPPGTRADWWPAGLGQPSAAGGQNDMRYACFPGQNRLAVMRDGRVTVYDTGVYRISGFSQQQGAGQRLTFSSQMGNVGLEDLRVV